MNHSTPVQAVSVGHALNVDLADRGVVHSVFVRAVNLLLRGEMWTLLTEDRGDLPFGIRVALPKFDKLGLVRGDMVSVKAGFVGIGSSHVVDCRAAPRWVPVQGKEPVGRTFLSDSRTRMSDLQPGLEQRLGVVARAARDKSWPESASMAHALRFAINDPTALGAVLARVVGRGPGATPSGDDVLVGVLAVLTSPHSGQPGARAAESLGRSLLPLLSTTTDMSGHMLRQAMNGQFGRDVHELIAALIGTPPSPQPLSPEDGGEELVFLPSPPLRGRGVGGEGACSGSLTPSPQPLSPEDRGEGLVDKVRRVIETGATSGADMCQGLVAFAPSYFADRQERGSL